ncbi:hypothetical protein BJ878DRAFT_410896 [Calycina marina]|uniref:F-box domain-containing protein n=1 Tax=Calycina marina TaxID=1763456 RepID=A0A9P7ZCA2_9HELO|nr:hypothetical protein BJ878DRAFT_410896 [Calycina marina]
MEDSNAELESFRQKWREEVQARARSCGNTELPQSTAPSSSRRPPAAPRIPSGKVQDVQEENGYFVPMTFTEPGTASHAEGSSEADNTKLESKEPKTALEHYEKAVERESLGSLGDSLSLYRKAFKLDHKVDQKYRNKHFPPSLNAPKLASATQDTVLPAPTAERPVDATPSTINQLLAGFANLSIEPAMHTVEGTPALPCPIADLPSEILIHIFQEVAILDVAAFAKLAQVCKHMAFLVATEESIWKAICQGTEVGFAGMHYEWQRGVLGEPLEPDIPDSSEESAELATPAITTISRDTITDALLRGVYRSSWQQMFRLRPRIRFNGCYISTNNYIRPGQASANQLTWNSPVHIVTYYRYLRFFRDGTLISLLSTSEPTEVVHHLSKELLVAHRNKKSSHLPSAVMESALRGRWRISPINEHPDVDLKDAEGHLCVETEGVGPKYVYRVDLSLRSAGKGAMNNKLVCGGFWSYNKLTDDWAEFSRRNEKPLFWSRVRSYGKRELS